MTRESPYLRQVRLESNQYFAVLVVRPDKGHERSPLLVENNLKKDREGKRERERERKGRGRNGGGGGGERERESRGRGGGGMERRW